MTEKDYLCIGENINVIPDSCFKGLKTLKRIDFKGDISYLGKNAFFECENLEEINFYGKLDYYDSEVFKNLEKLKRIYFQDIKIIQQNTFAKLSSLEYITIKSGLELIEDGAFENCENLKILRLPLPAPTIEDKYIIDSDFVEFIHSNYHTINFGKMIFWNNSCIESLIIPYDCKELSEWMFACCSNLEYIEIPDSVSKINKHCFSACQYIKEINYYGTISNFASIYPTYKLELNADCVIKTSDCPNGKTVSEWVVEK
ncbi:MAG: leucine-rich repeat domain-containing protein [Treponema sp.]|nr:leucine-rich repeat domain-containing protein [Treponema sp.]